MEFLIGKTIASTMKTALREKVSALTDKPSLTVLANDLDASSSGYVASLKKTAAETGIRIEEIHMADDEEAYLRTIDRLNEDETCSAVLITRPLPPSVNEKRVSERLSPGKDADCLHPFWCGKIFAGEDDLAPATAKAVILLLEQNAIPIQGKKCLVIGRSVSVGKPVGAMLLNRNATVTFAHSKTVDLDELVADSDILVCAVGKPHFLDSAKAKESAIVIDAGIHYLPDGIVGDVIPSDRVKRISKVPGGVGVITNAALFENVVKLHERQAKRNGIR